MEFKRIQLTKCKFHAIIDVSKRIHKENPMNNINFLSIEDEIIFAIRDLQKLIFLSECYDLYRRNQIPNLEHNSFYYTEDILDELQSDLINLMLQHTHDLDVLTDNLFEWFRVCKSDSEGDAPTPERTPCAGGASPTEEISRDKGSAPLT